MLQRDVTTAKIW